jgi:hypothetical protein
MPPKKGNTAISKISKEAKRLKTAGSKKPWKELIKEASAKYRAGKL